jgi:hypothetical protein
MHSPTIIIADGSEPTPSSRPTPAPADDTGRKPSPFQGAGAGYIMVAAALLGLGLGWLIDRSNGTTPRWTITCLFLFLIAGTYHMIKEGRK